MPGGHNGELKVLTGGCERKLFDCFLHKKEPPPGAIGALWAIVCVHAITFISLTLWFSQMITSPFLRCFENGSSLCSSFFYHLFKLSIHFWFLDFREIFSSWWLWMTPRLLATIVWTSYQIVTWLCHTPVKLWTSRRSVLKRPSNANQKRLCLHSLALD